MAGTFDVLPQTVVKIGAWTNSGDSDAGVLSGDGTGALTSPNGPVNGLSLDCTNNDITLDGSPGHNINNLPVGFNIANINLAFDYNATLFGNFSQVKFLWDLLVVKSGFPQGQGHQIGSINFYNAGTGITVPTFADLFGDHWGFTCNIVDTSSIAFRKLTIHGAYNIIANSFSIPNAAPYVANQQVTITATANLDALAGIILAYTDPITHIYTQITIQQSQFVSQSPTSLTFTIPSNLNIAAINTVSCFGVFNGVTFFGQVFLGTLSIFLADASGIYVLTQGKATDTLYGAGTGNIRSQLNVALFNLLNEDFEEPQFELAIPFVNPNNLINIPTVVKDEEDEELLSDETDIAQQTNVVIVNTTDNAIPNPFAVTGFLP